MIRILIFAALMWSSCIYAIVRGGRSERIVAITFLIGTGLTQAVMPSAHDRFRHVELRVLLIDLAVFAVLFGVALFSRKFWPLWITAMQGVAILAHFSPLMLIVPRAYGAAIALWSWPMMILLGVVTYRHDRARTRKRLPG
jgi:hypothetical protein